jgi:hypothetical protein
LEPLLLAILDTAASLHLKAEGRGDEREREREKRKTLE